jgi:predicted pyridoxine 5'-phosphate oxidase superfamily flavin-nucleotide-binding protein
MAKVYEVIDERLRSFIEAQPMFFVATAPASGGHVNVSPKWSTS